MERMMRVAGAFYPAECEEVEAMISAFNRDLEEQLGEEPLPELAPQAIVVPHAGYLYSGFTANIAYRVAARRRDFARAVVLGPSHRVGFVGVSGGSYERFVTPCGALPIDEEYLRMLRERFGVGALEAAHEEHSTEVQMPFLYHYFGTLPVVELVYARPQKGQLEGIVEAILEDPDTLLVVSTDLSHYHDEAEAGRLDGICIDAVVRLDPKRLDEGCEACGILGLRALLEAAQRPGWASRILNYLTSAAVTGDRSNVVGYLSAAIYRA